MTTDKVYCGECLHFQTRVRDGYVTREVCSHPDNWVTKQARETYRAPAHDYKTWDRDPATINADNSCGWFAPQPEPKGKSDD